MPVAAPLLFSGNAARLSRDKKTPPLPCVTVPVNFFATFGTGWIAFDFH